MKQAEIIGDGTTEYSVAPARYAKGKLAVRCPSPDGYKTRASYLIGTLSHRYSGREKSYIMSPSAVAKFEKLYAAGWDATCLGTLIPPRRA